MTDKVENIKIVVHLTDLFEPLVKYKNDEVPNLMLRVERVEKNTVVLHVVGRSGEIDKLVAYTRGYKEGLRSNAL